MHLTVIFSDEFLYFQPSLDNIHALVHCFTNSSQARKEGLKFQDTIYECVRADRFSVYAKKVSMKYYKGALKCLTIPVRTRMLELKHKTPFYTV